MASSDVRIWLYFVCRSKLSSPFQQQTGQATEWAWEMGKSSSSEEKSSQLEMGDVWLGVLATGRFGGTIGKSTLLLQLGSLMKNS